MRHTFAFLAAAALFAAPAAAQSDFQWHGLVLSGQSIEIKGINGEIRAVAGSGDAQVTASKTARRSNPADVRIDVAATSSVAPSFTRMLVIVFRS